MVVRIFREEGNPLVKKWDHQNVLVTLRSTTALLLSP